MKKYIWGVMLRFNVGHICRFAGAVFASVFVFFQQPLSSIFLAIKDRLSAGPHLLAYLVFDRHCACVCASGCGFQGGGGGLRTIL